jgi:hypothetical protein
LTKHGLMRTRYLDVTAQARRLPVAVSLIVDQDHVDRVQTAFANSKLRFLMTQVILNRYPSSLLPPLLAAQGGGGVFNPMPMGDGGGIKKVGSAPPPMFPMVPPDFIKGGFGPMGVGMNPAATSTSEEMETNVELVLYGIVTLYERYPTANRPVPGN